MGKVFVNPLTELVEYEELNRSLNEKEKRFRSAAAWIPRRCISCRRLGKKCRGNW